MKGETVKFQNIFFPLPPPPKKNKNLLSDFYYCSRAVFLFFSQIEFWRAQILVTQSFNFFFFWLDRRRRPFSSPDFASFHSFINRSPFGFSELSRKKRARIVLIAFAYRRAITTLQYYNGVNIVRSGSATVTFYIVSFRIQFPRRPVVGRAATAGTGVGRREENFIAPVPVIN